MMEKTKLNLFIFQKEKFKNKKWSAFLGLCVGLEIEGHPCTFTWRHPSCWKFGFNIALCGWKSLTINDLHKFLHRASLYDIWLYNMKSSLKIIAHSEIEHKYECVYEFLNATWVSPNLNQTTSPNEYHFFDNHTKYIAHTYIEDCK